MTQLPPISSLFRGGLLNFGPLPRRSDGGALSPDAFGHWFGAQNVQNMSADQDGAMDLDEASITSRSRVPGSTANEPGQPQAKHKARIQPIVFCATLFVEDGYMEGGLETLLGLTKAFPWPVPVDSAAGSKHVISAPSSPEPKRQNRGPGAPRKKGRNGSPTSHTRYTAEQETWLDRFVTTHFSVRGVQNNWTEISKAFNARWGQQRSPSALAVKWQHQKNQNKALPESKPGEDANNPPRWTVAMNQWMLDYAAQHFEFGKDRDYDAMAEAFGERFAKYRPTEGGMQRRFIQLQDEVAHEQRLAREALARERANAKASAPPDDDDEILDGSVARKRYTGEQCRWLWEHVPRMDEDWTAITAEFGDVFRQSRTPQSVRKKYEQLQQEHEKEKNRLRLDREAVNSTIAHFAGPFSVRPKKKDTH